MLVQVSKGGVLDDGSAIHRPGDLVDLEEKEAKRLLAAGAVESPAVELEQPLQIDGHEVDDLVEIIGTLPVDDVSMWTKSGDPKTEALGMIAGRAVSSKERDAAWKEYKQQQKAEDSGQ